MAVLWNNENLCYTWSWFDFDRKDRACYSDIKFIGIIERLVIDIDETIFPRSNLIFNFTARVLLVIDFPR